jgi:uncharacterized protein
MKTQTFSSVCIAATLFAASTFLTLQSCKGPTEKALADSTATATDVKPAVDIHTAVITENLGALQQHIQAGSNLNEKDPFGGSSPLITAAVFGKPEMARVLIEAGADINFTNNDGSTPLHTAAFFCRPEIVRMLLDKGADKTVRNKYGATAYESVAGPFADVKEAYDMMGKMLLPMGLKLDYAYIEKTRPVIADMLQ